MPRPTIAPRPGRAPRLGDRGARARAFPGGAARARLRLAVRMLAIEEVVAAWLGRCRRST